MRATRPPNRGQRPSLPSDPLTVGRRDCMHVMHGPSLSVVVLHGVDLADEVRGDRPRLDTGLAVAGVDQGDTGTVDAGDGASREFGDVAEHFDHTTGAGHDPGNPGQPGVQVQLVGLELGGGQLRQPAAVYARAGRRTRPW